MKKILEFIEKYKYFILGVVIILIIIVGGVAVYN